jgi:hypothetical protein
MAKQEVMQQWLTTQGALTAHRQSIKDRGGYGKNFLSPRSLALIRRISDTTPSFSPDRNKAVGKSTKS